ncbi:MAG: hypothetical protein ABIQ49_08395 [Gemmatimonadales bacterium]
MEELAERLSSALAGRFRISLTVGTGGLAVVFRADDLKHDRPVAIKILKPDIASPSGTTGSSARSRSPRGSSTPTSWPCLTPARRPAVLSLFERDWDRAARELYEVLDLERLDPKQADLTRSQAAVAANPASRPITSETGRLNRRSAAVRSTRGAD